MSENATTTTNTPDGACGYLLRQTLPRLDLRGHAGAGHGVAFSIDGKRIVSGSWDQTLKVWDTAVEKSQDRP